MNKNKILERLSYRTDIAATQLSECIIDVISTRDGKIEPETMKEMQNELGLFVGKYAKVPEPGILLPHE